MGKEGSKFFWKGKRVKEKVYKNRIRMVDAGKRLCEIRPKHVNNETDNLQDKVYNTRSSSTNQDINSGSQNS